MTIEEIYNLAEELAKKYNPRGIAPFPYDAIERDREDLKILLTDRLNEEISGAINFIKEESKFFILINKNKPDTRKNFTIAHELGHYFLHPETVKKEEAIIDADNTIDSSILFRLDNAEYSRIETEANNFAASLIMPEDLVRKAWDDLSDIKEIANVFKVSPSAMSIRLEKLGIIT